MASGQWEVVSKGKKTKQNGQIGSKLTKSEKKKFAENAPKVEDILPPGQLHTLYNVFDINKENKENRKPTEKETKSKDADSKKTQKKQQLEKKKEVREKPPKSLEEAIELIDLDEITAILDNAQLRFPDAPLIWLKNLMSYLNSKLSLEHNDPVFSSKPKDYPVCLLSEDIQGVIMKAVDACTGETLQIFFENCLTSMANDMTKGTSVLGSKLMLQLVARYSPRVTFANIPKFTNLRNSYQNRQPVGLSILWALGQGGFVDLPSGLKVWLEVMLPILELKNYSRYIVAYLNSLLEFYMEDGKLPDDAEVVDVLTVFQILDKMFSPSLSLPASIQKDLHELFPKLRAVAFDSCSDTGLHNFFPLFLERLQASIPASLREEILSCLTKCLVLDLNCYSIWRQMYASYLPQTTILLRHISTNWKSFEQQLPKKLLKETLPTFIATNEELGKGRGNQDSLQECTQLCEEILKKMTVSRTFPWRRGSFLLLLAICGLLAYDIRRHGSFRSCSTGRFLNDVGALQYGEHAWGRARFYSLKSYRWAEENVPHYYKEASEQARPYLQYAWEKSVIVGVYLKDVFENTRTYVEEKTPVVVNWINQYAPGLIDKVKYYSFEAWEAFKFYSLLTWDYTLQYSYLALEWIRTNVLIGKLSPENLQRYTLEAYNTTQLYATRTYEWVWQKVQTLSKIQ